MKEKALFDRRVRVSQIGRICRKAFFIRGRTISGKKGGSSLVGGNKGVREWGERRENENVKGDLPGEECWRFHPHRSHCDYRLKRT